MSWSRSPCARADPRTSRAATGAHSRAWTVACRLGFPSNAVRFRGSTARFRAPVAHRALSSRPAFPAHAASTCAVSSWVTSGTSTAPPPNLSRASRRRAHRERRKTRRVLRETRAAAATGTTDARLETRERRRGEMCSPDRETRFRRTRAVVSTRRGVPALFRPRASRVGGRLVEGCAAPRRILARRTVGHLLSRSRGHSPPRPPCLSDPSAPA